MTNTLIHPAADRTITSGRLFPVDQKTLYRSWADPAWKIQWWGPKGFTNTFHVHELNAGGRWSFIMHGPDGQNYDNECVFVEIDEPKFLAWNHLGSHAFQVQVSFQAVRPNETKVKFQMIFPSAEACESLRSFIEEKNEENFDKLEKVLEAMTKS